MKKLKRQKIDDHFFDQWSSNMAYVLGLIVADGSISKRKGRKSSYIMNITSKDKSLLEKVQEAMSSQYKIGVKSSGYLPQKKYFYIQVSNKKICEDLIKRGVLPRKTYHLDPIHVPTQYFSDFVRGFFDGDGTVYIYQVNGTPQIKASFKSASALFIADLNKHLCQHLNIPQKSIHPVIPKRKNRTTLYSVDFYVSDCQKLASFMYKDHPFLYLARKREIFEKWKSISRRRYLKQNYPSKVGRRFSCLKQ